MSANATNTVEINEARKKIGEKGARGKRRNRAGRTQRGREKERKKEGSTDSMTRFKLYSGDEQDHSEFLPRGASRRIASRRLVPRKDKSKIKALGGGCISRDRNLRGGRKKGRQKARRTLSEQDAGEEKRKRRRVGGWW